MKRKILLGAAILLVAGLAGVGWLYREKMKTTRRDLMVIDFLRNPTDHTDWMIQASQRCGNAPFLLPSTGFIGYLWDDSFRPGHHHQGIDIFGGGKPGVTPVIAAADGYLTRLPDWKSSLIIRLPRDPLHPDRQIWLYYTHLADPQGNSLIDRQYPAGTSEKAVRAGDPLGYQGNYSGNPASPVGVHLHFSIVLDDGRGKFRNELEIGNTLDPSPYLGLPLNANLNRNTIPLCK
ncbi:MAG TPA: M23 family metallopeptidase [Anaerolineaceae bacterium]